jgi:hypothetical protein
MHAEMENEISPGGSKKMQMEIGSAAGSSLPASAIETGFWLSRRSSE